MNALAVLSTFLLGEAQNEASWMDENSALEGLLEAFLGEEAASAEASFDEFGDDELIALAANEFDDAEDSFDLEFNEEEDFDEFFDLEFGDEQDGFDEMGDEKLIAMAAAMENEYPWGDDDNVELDEGFGPAGRRRQAGVRMNSLGFGVCRTANGGAGRYRGLNTGTQERCRSICLADPRCVALEFTFLSSPVNPGWCEIHYERITKKVYTVTNMCEVKVGTTPPAPAFQMSSLGFGVCRTATGGAGRYRGLNTGTQEKCREICMADARCVALEFTFLSSPINPGWCEIHYERITKKIHTVTNMCEVKIPRGGRRLEENELSEEVAVEAPIADENDDRRRAVRMSSLGFGVCRTANGGAGRYRSERTATQEQCRAKCMAETACVAFEYTFMSSPINPGWCEIHYERITKKVYTVTNMCEIKVGTPTPAPAVRMSSLGFGVCRTANGGAGRYRGYKSGTQEKCREQCLAEARCTAFEFTFLSSRVNPGWCEIHYERITKKVYTVTNMCEVKITTGGRRMDESDALPAPSDDVDLEF